MEPLRDGRCAGKVAKVLDGHWRTLTFIAALRHDRKPLEQPWRLDAVNAKSVHYLCRET
jgi:hypothetical protein